MAPYILGFGILCSVMSYGLLRRKRWMWYLGWVIFYVFAARFGHWFFSALFLATSPRDVGFALMYFVGGFVFWILAAVWWARNRDLFDS